MNRGPVWVLIFSALLVTVPPAAGDDFGPVPQNDAGSGADAPDDVSKAVGIQPDVVYAGSSTGPALDFADVYHLVGSAGQVFKGWSEGNAGCYYLLDSAGSDLGFECSYEHAPMNTGPLVLTLPYSGDYYFRVIHLAPAIYKLAYSLTGDAPDVRTLVLLQENEEPDNAVRLPIPDGCNDQFITLNGLARFTDDCYHMRTNLNALDTPEIDVLVVPPASAYPERDLRVMRQAVEMWASGIETLAPQMGLQWLSDGVDFEIFVDDDALYTDPVWDPEIVVVASNPVGGLGIGVDPLDFVFGASGPCHGQPNPLAGFEDWARLDGFDSHHDGLSGTFSVRCEGGGTLCFAVNGAIDPAPGIIDFFGLYDLVAHEVGHCLTVGHVGDAGDHKADAVPYADIMSYTDQTHDKCVSTLDVESFALTMSRYLLATPIAANDGDSPAGSFQIQHPSDHWYASPTGLASDCPQPDAGLVPGGGPGGVPVHDDAGSGRDAPNAVSKDVTVLPDRVYRGTSPGPIVDSADYYHLVGQAGQVFRGWSDGNLGCYYLHNAQGDQIDYECSYEHAPINTGPLAVPLPYSGDYYLRIVHLAPAVYHFAFSLSGPPPSVKLIDQV